ncbi:MAG: hypothetical protein PHE25_04560, partial [Candidatus Gracilibacteria bacterium]|nr:hypothetical protein [Candidatus Gracilibacteria bacterium]
MDNNEIITTVQEILQNSDFMQLVFQNIYSYDNAIGIAFQGDYNILPKLIFPLGADGNGNIYAMVSFDTTRNGINIGYTGLVTLTPTQMNFQIMYPGASNTDYTLFNDIFGVISGLAGENSLLADTKLITEITPSGWSEEWTFLLSDKSKITKNIDFTTSPNGGTIWNIRAN